MSSSSSSSSISHQEVTRSEIGDLPQPRPGRATGSEETHLLPEINEKSSCELYRRYSTYFLIVSWILEQEMDCHSNLYCFMPCL